MAKTNLRAIKEWASSYSLQKVTPFCFIFQCTLMTSCFLSLIAYTMWSNSWVIKFCLEWHQQVLIFEFSLFNIQVVRSTLIIQCQCFVLLFNTYGCHLASKFCPIMTYSLPQSPNLQTSSTLKLCSITTYFNVRTCYLKL
jgi:hypothetical protein